METLGLYSGMQKNEFQTGFQDNLCTLWENYKWEQSETKLYPVFRPKPGSFSINFFTVELSEVQ